MLVLIIGSCVNAENANTQINGKQTETKKRIPKTLGGMQFWGDIKFFRGWKIQQNVYSGHYRLLDPKLRRHESGTLKKCLSSLEKTKAEKHLKPMSGKCVILVHGIGCSASIFRKHQAVFSKEGYTVIPFQYPSTRIKIESSAEYLNRMITSLDGISEINIIAHSMGGLVSRAWFAKYTDPRMNRFIMMGTPNKGARLAKRFHNFSAFRLLLGPAGEQMAVLTKKNAKIQKQFAVPQMEFAIIAGGKNDHKGYSTLIPGDDDGRVSTESAKLSGAADFCQVSCQHMSLINNTKVVEMCKNFIAIGKLNQKSPAHPIP